MSARILVVDDEAAAMADTLQAGLEAHGHVVTATSTGDGALAALDAEPFDVVVTDVRMRGASGIDLCRRVVGNRPDLPVIVMTAFGTMETAVASMRAGAFDRLTTPFEIDELGFAVARALQHCALRELGQHFVARSAARNRKAVTQLSPAVAEIGCSPTPGRATSASSRPARRGRPATQGEGLPGEPRGPRHRGSDGMGALSAGHGSPAHLGKGLRLRTHRRSGVCLPHPPPRGLPPRSPATSSRLRGRRIRSRAAQRRSFLPDGRR